jgi:hypothetical protein
MKLFYSYKDGIRVYLYSTIAVILALVCFLLLTYLNFFVHELGHANSAVLYTFLEKNQSVTTNFTYINFMGKDYLKVPQQTIAQIPPIMLSYGVLFSLFFYSFIFILLAKIKRVGGNKLLEYPLAISFLTLILQDVVLNLFCGTDGLRLSCGNYTIKFASYFFSGVLILSLGFFFVILFFSKKIVRKESTK